jgi:uncharacterized protein (DUF305 family)
MAKVELAHGKDPEMRPRAEDVVCSEEKEIEIMQAWLNSHAK